MSTPPPDEHDKAFERYLVARKDADKKWNDLDVAEQLELLFDTTNYEGAEGWRRLYELKHQLVDPQLVELLRHTWQELKNDNATSNHDQFLRLDHKANEILDLIQTCINDYDKYEQEDSIHKRRNMIVSFEYIIKFTRQLQTIMYAMSFLDQDAKDQALYDNQLQPALQILQEWEEKARAFLHIPTQNPYLVRL